MGDQASVEMNYIELIQKILLNKKRLVQFSLGGLVLGVLIAFTSPVEYTSTSLVILEETEKGVQLGQMGALAGLAGISLPQMQGEHAVLNSELFPDVIHSRDFLIGISKESFFFHSKGKEMTLEEYYAEERPGNIIKKTFNFIFSIPARIAGLFSSQETPALEGKVEPDDSTIVPYVLVSSSEIFAMNHLKDRIFLEDERKLIELKVTMPEPLIAAQVNALVFERLIQYVTNYKTAKQKVNLEFIEERVQEAENKFQQAQMKLASYRDSNQGIVSRKAMAKEEQLDFEFNIAFNVFNSMKQELEQATIQLKKDTPIFTVLDQASIPLGPSKPNKPLIIVFSLFLGFFFGVLYSTYRILLSLYIK
ncbi:uncharacterized protein involved in exopolysaccharide biosynthesis [Algoriphagus sp. 4150]|uniref:GNVR domain-containing protein n=1 Tax=Algoriphagus sp. 4150 TaxID=2817756 RepID=UPI002861DD27|nr:GNVR domain-containing protein [Algoriphagus sp. 4150]MDR7130524.1 uncharacterized protein involved in exopolysaccharide biosynthesis [Algoriphagus sp. 4150]